MIKRRSNKTKQLATNNSYDKTHKLEPLRLFIVIVPYGQANAILKYLKEVDSTFSFIATGEGTGTKETYELFGLSDSKKQIISAIVRKDKVEILKEKLKARFSVSRAAAGIAFSFKLTSVAGVSVYKFLSNSRELKE